VATDGFAFDRFPRASMYHPDWIRESVGGGANSLWLTEWLAEALELRPAMRVLDLGCGRGASSMFLHREFGVQVWATDLWFSAEERSQRIRDAGVVDGGVVAIHADARALPFDLEFFDAIVSIDSFPYYGTDDLYLGYLARFVKPGGAIGIAGAGLMHEIDGAVPEHLAKWWTRDLWCLHSASWWRRHWEKPEIVDVNLADAMPDGWRRWLDWHRAVAPDNAVEIEALEADEGRTLGYVRVAAKRRPDVVLDDPIVSLPAQHTKHPLLRDRIAGGGDTMAFRWLALAVFVGALFVSAYPPPACGERETIPRRREGRDDGRAALVAFPLFISPLAYVASAGDGVGVVRCARLAAVGRRRAGVVVIASVHGSSAILAAMSARLC
jgi:SAM-dependent methyltransferase